MDKQGNVPFEPLGIVDDRTLEQLEADGDTHWPDGTPYKRWRELRRKKLLANTAPRTEGGHNGRRSIGNH